MGEINNIQYLRAIAAIAVLGFHLSQQFHGNFGIGEAGVDVFFVISGFIMWVTTSGRSVPPQRFVARRLTRIVPVYWIATAITAGAIALRPQFFFGQIATAENIARSLVFLPVLDNGELRPVVLQAWTLCYEMMFYGIFALTLLLPERRRFPVLLVALVAIAVLHFDLGSPYGRAFTDPVLLEFAAGAAIGWVWMRKTPVSLAFAAAMLAIGIALMFTVGIETTKSFRALGWGIPATMIVGGAVFVERKLPLRALPPLLFLGNASYSIYIWQVLLTTIFTGMLLRLAMPVAAQPILLFVLCLLGTSALYWVVEKPLVRLLHGRRTPPKTGTPLQAASSSPDG